MYRHIVPRHPGQLRALQWCGSPLSAAPPLSSSHRIQPSSLLFPPPPPSASARAAAAFHSSPPSFSPRFSSVSSSVSSSPQPMRSLVTGSGGSHQQSPIQLGATSPRDVGLLLSAASAGNVEHMRQALALGSCTVNDGDYDRRKVHHTRAPHSSTSPHLTSPHLDPLLVAHPLLPICVSLSASAPR